MSVKFFWKIRGVWGKSGCDTNGFLWFQESLVITSQAACMLLDFQNKPYESSSLLL
jgi:hypothetical protein